MKIVLGMRKSQVPLVQSKAVERILQAAGVEVELKPVETVGDALDIALAEQSGSAVYSRELDDALQNGSIDVAVHDMKDVPLNLSQGLAIAAVTARLDPREAFISTQTHKFNSLASNSRVGVSGLCTTIQLARLRPDLEMVRISGDVDVRLKLLKEGDVDALILPASSLIRLGIGGVITEFIALDKLIPSVGQGATAVMVRSADKEILRVVKQSCHNNATGIAVRAERSVARSLLMAQDMPFAAHAEIEPSGISIIACLASSDGSQFVSDHVSGPLDQAAALGAKLGDKLMEKISS